MVLLEADIYEVYRVLQEAERACVLEFEEGHQAAMRLKPD